MLEVSPFERVVRVQHRSGFTVSALAATWDAVVFTVDGPRSCVACVPRSALGAFFADLDAGRLDATINDYLARPPCGRVLRATAQTGEPGLFDELERPGAIAPPERVPGRLPGLGGHGRNPADARRNKDRHRPRPRVPRSLLVAGVATVAVIGAAAAIALTRSDHATPVATVSQGGPVTTGGASVTSVLQVQCQIAGTWNVVSGSFYRPTFAFTQAGTRVTGIATLPEGQWENAGWQGPSNPFAGSLVGDQLDIVVDAPHIDGTPSHGEYKGTVTPAEITGIAFDQDAPARGSVDWSASGGQATCQ